MRVVLIIRYSYIYRSSSVKTPNRPTLLKLRPQTTQTKGGLKSPPFVTAILVLSDAEHRIHQIDEGLERGHIGAGPR